MGWTLEDVITTDKYFGAFPDDYIKTDVLITRRRLLWRGRVIAPPTSFRSRIICGHSDGGVTTEMTHEFPAGSWWSVNSRSEHVRGLPLGITNHTNESDDHPVFGNVQMMLDVVAEPRTTEGLLYANFAVHTHESRGPLMEFAESTPWITVGTTIKTLEGRRTFLQAVRNHSFVLCPPGAGVDTHRLWETLYMGSIPIVKRDIAHAAWQDLPILFVDSWDEVTEERLIAEKQRIESTEWNMEKLKVGYWINAIREDTMKIGTVVTATDLNPLYCDFIPNFVRAWKAVIPEADVRIILVADEIPEALLPWSEHLVLFKPIPRMLTAFQAQCIRLLYPREVKRDEGVLITDMDMLPGNRRYYMGSAALGGKDRFIVYRDVCFPGEIAMCYNAAHPSVWTSLFGSEPTEMVLKSWYPVDYDGAHGGVGWGTDQLKFKQIFDAWTGPKVVLNDAITQFTRLDRIHPWNFTNRVQLRNTIVAGFICDYHCLRPYSEHKDINDFIVSCLEERTW
jgi:hypothetical protein